MKFNANLKVLGRIDSKDSTQHGRAFFVDMTAAPSISPSAGDLVISTATGTFDAGWSGLSGSVTASTETYLYNGTSYEAWHAPVDGSKVIDITTAASPELKLFNGTSWVSGDHPDGGDGITFDAGDNEFNLDLATSSGLELTAADGTGQLQIADDGVTAARIATDAVGADALNEADAKLRSQSFTITGDGSETSFDCTHNWSSQLIHVEIVDDSYNTVIPDSITRTDGNTVTITFHEAIANTVVYRAFLKEIGTESEAAATPTV